MTTREVLSSDTPVSVDLGSMYGSGEEKLVKRNAPTAEQVLGLEKARLTLISSELKDAAEEHPRYVSALEQWVNEEVVRITDSEVPVEDVRIAEAVVLDRLIAEFANDGEEPTLVKLANVLRRKVEVEQNIDELMGQIAA